MRENVNLEELFKIGSSKRVYQSEWKEEGIPFYKAREIAKLAKYGYVDNELFINEELYQKYIDIYGQPEAGDIMVTGVGTIGVCYLVKDNDRFYFKDGNILWFSQKAKDRVLPEYVVKSFNSKTIKDQIKRNSSGTTVGTFTIQTAKKIMIGIPSIEEQSIIVSKLSKIEFIIDYRVKQLQLLDTLIKSRFIEMFGFIDETKFDVYELKEITEFITDGTHQTPTYTDDKVNGFKFLSSKDVTSGKINWSKIKYVPSDSHEKLYKRVSPQRNDILLAKNGTTGVAALVDNDEVFDIYVSLAILRFKEGNNPYYLLNAINSVDTKRQFNSSLKGAGVPNLHLGEIRKTRIVLPPIEMQNQYADFIKQVDKLKVEVQKSLDETQILFDSLMQEYFE